MHSFELGAHLEKQAVKEILGGDLEIIWLDWVWWYMTTIPDTGKLRQNCDFEASLGYRVRPY
jgi:hypothetical protein